jgi:hypothetical protein
MAHHTSTRGTVTPIERLAAFADAIEATVIAAANERVNVERRDALAAVEAEVVKLRAAVDEVAAEPVRAVKR